MEELQQTERTRLKRLPKRGVFDRATVNAIIDAALYSHVGFVHQGSPFVIPTLHVRIGDELFIHGSTASRMLRSAADGIPLCVTVTHIDGLVLARSAFHHSINYRSVVILGTAKEVSEPADKARMLEALVEHVVPGRWSEARPPAPKELAATSVLCLPISEASAKVRTGNAADDEEDYAMPIWAGTIPIRTVTDAPLADDRILAGVTPPAYVRHYLLPNARRDGNGKVD